MRAQQHLGELAADARLVEGVWAVRIEQQRFTISTPGGEWIWPLADIRRTDLKPDHLELTKAIVLRTPIFLLPIPPRLLHAEAFCQAQDIITEHIAEEHIPRPWPQI